MKNKINNRTCFLTKLKKPKQELIRFIVKDNKLILDKNNNLGSRGYYISYDNATIELLENKKIMFNRLKVDNINEFINDLISWLGEKNEGKETN